MPGFPTGPRAGASTAVAVAGLVAANLLPLVGVVWFGWSLHELLVVYWLENGVVGLANVPKILVAAGADERSFSMTVNGRPVTLPDPPADPGDRPRVRPGNLPVAGFFCLHYGIFWAVHGVFVLAFPAFAPGMVPVSLASLPVVALGTGAMVLSHGVSLYANFLRGDEWRTVGPGDRMGAPYGRVVVLHLTIILGAFAVVAVGAPVAALAVMVVCKTGLDLAAHLREHRRDGAGSRDAAGTDESVGADSPRA